MVRIVFVITLLVVALAGPALAQTPGPGSSSAVSSGDTVLTIHGLCSFSRTPLAAGAEDCTAVVSRRQFDDLLKIASPGSQVTTAMKRSLAETYTDLLAFEIAAKKSGIDNLPQFQETMEWLQLRALADLYRRGLEQESSIVSEQEIDEYYLRHVSQFEEVKLRRMLVPRNGLQVSDSQAWEKKALGIATEFRERAARGEDLDQLQKEAYTAVGFNTPPPATDVGNRRRGGLTSGVSEHVFALKPGEVSGVEMEPYSFVIYKVDAKRTLPRELVREEISREIAKQKLETALKAVTGGIRTDLNENYFGPAAKH